MTVRSNSRLLYPAAALIGLSLLAGVMLMSSRHEPAQRDAGVALSADGRPEAMKAGAFDPPHIAPDFSLPGSDGSEVTLGRYRGKVVLLTFGFTYCPAVCPTTLATLAQARNKLGKAADSVQVVFVTVDPHRDSASAMQKYLAAFDPTFIGATGNPGVLAAAREKYGVTAVKQGSGDDYAMGHTSSIFLIDRDGRLRAMMPFGHDAADFVHDIKLLLA